MSSKPHKSIWKRVLIWIFSILGVLIILCGIALWIISWHLSPERIARLLEEKSSEYIDGDIKIGSLDYTIFKHYPWITFEVDSLEVISHSLNKLSEEELRKLPESSDSLASIERLKGKLNIHYLMKGDIHMKEIEVVRPKVNIVMYNDSISNFNIAKNLPKTKGKIPELEIEEVKMSGPVDFSFFTLKDDAEGKLSVNDLYLKYEGEKSYRLDFEGNLEGRYKDFSLPGSIPIEFNTGISVDLPNITAVLNNLRVVAAGLAVEASGDIKADKTGLDVSKADIKVSVDDIFKLLQYLPLQLLQLVPLPEGLGGILPLSMDLTFTKPWKLNMAELDTLTNFSEMSLDKLPSVMAVLRVNDANLEFNPPHGKRVEADDIYLEALLNFEPGTPENTYLKLQELRLAGEGISLSANLNVDNLLGEEQPVEGEFFFHSALMESLSYLLPKSGIKILGSLKGEMEFSGTALSLGQGGIKGLEVSGDLLSKSLRVNMNGQQVRVGNFKGDYKAHVPQLPFNNNYAGTQLDFDLSADSITSTQKGGPNVKLTALKMKFDAIDTVTGTPDPSGVLDIDLGGLRFSQGGNQFTGEKIGIKANGALNPGGGNSNYTTVSPTTGGDDALIASRVDHTPLVVEYDGGGMLQTIMTMVNLTAEIYMGKGEFKTDAYLYPVEMKGVDLTTDLNRIEFSVDNLTLARSGLRLKGLMNGLQPFLTSYSATPLKLSAEVDFGNVDINQLSWGYYGALIAGGLSKDSAFYLTPMYPLTAADSVCVAIPRNIDALVKLKANSAEYMQYKFSPLSTDIIVKDGVATLSKLTIGAPYCTAVVDWTYSTASLADIFMDLKADVRNFSFKPFYGVFPELAEKAPEIINLTGNINANVACRFEMFPDMFMNGESLMGNFDVKATNMRFARQGKVEKITHLMLIHGDEPIDIATIDITGAYHDNLLQVNPFKICFDEYQLAFGGVNNTAGNIYYHFALEKSPFHLPFGVTLEGSFKKPEIKLGGTHIDDYKAGMVSTHAGKPLDIDIMAWLHHGWLLFVQEAAKYEGGLGERNQ